MSNTWYVSKTGNDTNVGSSSAPFLTIQKGVSSAIAGDTITVSAGIYRETVSFAKSGTAAAPIILQCAPGDTVVINGAEIVTGWTLSTGNIYQAPLGWDLGVGQNQLFVDGVYVPECRWPFPGIDISNPVKATVKSITFTSDTKGTIVDSALTQPDGYWNGCPMHIMGGEEWICSYGTVGNYTAGKFTYTSVNTDVGAFFQTFERLRPGNHYYLFGKPFPTQNPGQWFYSNGIMQLWCPLSDDPSTHTIEIKRRQLAIDFKGNSFINVYGIQTFAASATATGNSIVIDGLKAKYVSQFVLYNQWWAPNNSGISFNGQNCVIRNSVVQFSAGDGIFTGGGNNVAFNNTVLDTNYSACGGAAIHTWGSGHTIQNNTIERSGRCGVNYQASIKIKILNNDISVVMLQTTDGGGLYTDGQNGAGSEIAYNKTYNIHSGGFKSVGIYFDNGSFNYNCHHNLTYDVDIALKLNHPSHTNTITNNTFDATWHGIDYDTPDMIGSVFTNNIFTKQATLGANTTNTNNVFVGTDPQFVDAANRNYNLLPTTTHPTIGCFPVGSTPWIAGVIPVSVTPPPIVIPPVVIPPIVPATTALASSSTAALSYSSSNKIGSFNGAIANTFNGSYAAYSLDFGTGTLNQFQATISVGTGYAGQKIVLTLDSPTGTVIGTLTTVATGDWNKFTVQSTPVTSVSGVHTLYMNFVGTSGIANVQSFIFTTAIVTPPTVKPMTSLFDATKYTSASSQIALVPLASENLGAPTGVGYCNNGEWIKYASIDFGTGATMFGASVAVLAAWAGQTMEIHIDSITGPLIGSLVPQATSTWYNYMPQLAKISGASGVHDVYFVFKGPTGGICNIKAFTFGV